MAAEWTFHSLLHVICSAKVDMHYSNIKCSPEVSGGVVQGSLPASWGGFFSFPKLTRMNLAFNMDLGGPLPATWGGSGGWQPPAPKQAWRHHFYLK